VSVAETATLTLDKRWIDDRRMTVVLSAPVILG
jgi:hypothetical protein